MSFQDARNLLSIEAANRLPTQCCEMKSLSSSQRLRSHLRTYVLMRPQPNLDFSER